MWYFNLFFYKGYLSNTTHYTKTSALKCGAVKNYWNSLLHKDGK